MADPTQNLDAIEFILSGYWNVDSASDETGKRLGEDVRNSFNSGYAAKFKAQLASAVVYRSVSPMKLEEWTNLAFDSQEEVQAELFRIWQLVFSDEDPNQFAS